MIYPKQPGMIACDHTCKHHIAFIMEKLPYQLLVSFYEVQVNQLPFKKFYMSISKYLPNEEEVPFPA
ncbi:hypothetical protein ABH14_08890 [Brevibacillus brevis]|nr:hypothetical protein [Brevibacillus brevis]